MKKTTVFKRVGDFLLGRGYYIALALCVATIGISGYYLVSVFNSGQQPPDPQQVSGGAQVVIPDDEGDQPPLPDKSGVPQLDEHKESVQQQDNPAPQTEPPERQQTDKRGDGGTETVAAPPVYTWPVKGEIFSGFSLEVLAYDETMGDWRTHSGVDIAAAEGTRVLAMSSGTVSKVYEDDLMGMTVVIDHGDGLESRYQNLTGKPTVAEGDAVVTGTVIGAVGDTAIAELNRPAHLHLEVTLEGREVDPVGYLPQY
ncbi:MAG: M23 family metallopeptidase [Oscillospiraceae bacterium]|nr:M23 family metallopeptidase [Oscillospiraceae bacterium]